MSGMESLELPLPGSRIVDPVSPMEYQIVASDKLSAVVIQIPAATVMGVTSLGRIMRNV